VATLVIRLLGRPEIERDGEPVTPPRGHKSWAVLAYLLLGQRRVARAQLAALVFGDADDPLGALRWTLAQLRKALGTDDALSGDPLELRLPPGARVDALVLASDDPDPALVRGDLLEGIDPGAGPVFDAWLLVERRRVSGIAESVLRDAALQALAAGRALEGAALAQRALALDPYDENVHELLVRCLARAGEPGAARHHANACDVLLRRELGRAADPRIRRAAGDAGPGDEHTEGDRAAALGQLEAGRAAVAAGAVEPGVACLRQACAEARGVGDDALRARTLTALGTALVHGLRGHDEEGAAVLHEGLALAEAVRDRQLIAKSCRELGFVEVQAGRTVSAGRWLMRAGEAADDPDERAAVLGVRGMALCDRAHYDAAIRLLRESVATARACGDQRQAAWSLALQGRAHLLRGESDEATEVVDASLAIVAQERWIAFQPFPEVLRAELALRDGDPDQALALVEHAFSLGCRLGDPCWEALAARTRGLLHEAVGERTEALACLREAAGRAIRVADPYVWVRAHCLEALAGVAITDGQAEEAGTLIEELERLAARGDMRELVVRAALLRARRGEPGSAASARLLGEAIDNPALHAELAAAV
jgi:DNA-binding SARP family transcriptional activator